MPGLRVAQHGRRWLDSRDGRAGADHPPAPPRSRRAVRRRRATVYIHEPSRSWTSASVLRHGGTRDRVGGYRPLKHGLPAGAGHMHTIRVPGQGSGISLGRTFIPYLLSISAVRVPARAPSSRCWPASRRCNTRGSLALIVDDGRVRAGWLSLVAALPPRGRDPAACHGRSASHPLGGFTRPVSASRSSVSSSGLPGLRTCRPSTHRRAHQAMPPTTPGHMPSGRDTPQPGPGHRPARSWGPPQRQTATRSARLRGHRILAGGMGMQIDESCRSGNWGRSRCATWTARAVIADAGHPVERSNHNRTAARRGRGDIAGYLRVIRCAARRVTVTGAAPAFPRRAGGWPCRGLASIGRAPTWRRDGHVCHAVRETTVVLRAPACIQLMLAPHGCLRCAVIFCPGCAMRAARWMAPVPSQQRPRCVWRRWITGVPVLWR